MKCLAMSIRVSLESTETGWESAGLCAFDLFAGVYPSGKFYLLLQVLMLGYCFALQNPAEETPCRPTLASTIPRIHFTLYLQTLQIL